jgi:hypothetical protein
VGLRTWRVLRGEGTAGAEAEDDIPKGRPVRCGFVVVVLLKFVWAKQSARARG